MIPDQFPVMLEGDGSDYDGPLSTYKERHAAAIGVGLGLALLLGIVVDAVPPFRSSARSSPAR